MATYPKKLKSLTIYQLLNGDSVEVTDTATDDAATRALNEFKNYQTMHCVVEGEVYSIPYHAVQYIEVQETDSTIERADAYCEE